MVSTFILQMQSPLGLVPFFEKISLHAMPRLRSTLCSAQRVICHAHVATNYDRNYLPPAGGKVCDAFDPSQHAEKDEFV